MQINGLAVVAIISMALVTLVSRFGAVWLLSSVPASRKVEVVIGQTPGIIIAALVAPAAVQSGFAALPALIATVVVAQRTGSPPLAMVCGVCVVWAVRHLVI